MQVSLKLRLSAMTLLFLSLACSSGPGGFGGNKKKDEKEDAKNTGEKEETVSGKAQDAEQASEPGQVAGTYLVQQSFDSDRSTRSDIVINVAVSKKVDGNYKPLTSDEVVLNAEVKASEEDEYEDAKVEANNNPKRGSYSYHVNPENISQGFVRLTVGEEKQEFIKPLREIAPLAHDEIALGLVNSLGSNLKLGGNLGASAMRQTIEKSLEPDIFCDNGTLEEKPEPNLSANSVQDLITSGIKKGLSGATFEMLPIENKIVWLPNEENLKSSKLCFLKGKTKAGQVVDGWGMANKCAVFLLLASGNNPTIRVTRAKAISDAQRKEFDKLVDEFRCKS